MLAALGKRDAELEAQGPPPFDSINLRQVRRQALGVIAKTALVTSGLTAVAVILIALVRQ